MKALSMLAAAAVLVISGLAHAEQPSAVTISGPMAQERFEQMRADEAASKNGVKVIQNTSSLKSLRSANGKQTCTQTGSAGHVTVDSFSCDLQP